MVMFSILATGYRREKCHFISILQGAVARLYNLVDRANHIVLP